MKQILYKQDLLDKTIKRTAYTDNAFFLFFNDNTFCVFKGCGYGERDVELMSDEFDLNVNDSNFRTLYEIGLITNKQYTLFIEDYKEKIANSEIDHLKKLQKKYPNI